MPLDSGLLAILDDRGRGAARANALDVVIDDAAPQARLQRLLDLIEGSMLPRSLMASSAEQPLAMLLAASGRLHDFTWHAPADRDAAAEDGLDQAAAWTRALERLVLRAPRLEICLRIDTQTAPSDALGQDVARLRDLAGFDGRAANLTVAASRMKHADNESLQAGAAMTRAVGTETDLTLLHQQLTELSGAADRHIGALRGMLVGPISDGATLLRAAPSDHECEAGLVAPRDIAPMWLGWVKGSLGGAQS
ncbi:MAG: hypothetical protein HRU31_16590 [Rhodobacteraceae bacterium]|nr:hypothetical protein [Paracoccaceae bacterium]